MPGEPKKTTEERADMRELGEVLQTMTDWQRRIYCRAIDTVFGEWPAYRNRWPEKIDLAHRVLTLTKAELRTLRDVLFGSDWEDGETVTRRLLG